MKEEKLTNKNHELVRLMIVEIFAQEYGPELRISENAMDILISAYNSLREASSSDIPTADELLDEADEEENFVWILEEKEKYLLSQDTVEGDIESELRDAKAMMDIDDKLISSLEEMNKNLNKQILQYKKYRSFSIALVASFVVTTIVFAFRKKVR